MKKFRKEKGITLVALIITIVILLILAAVAIAAIQNENILSHANNAALKYNSSVDREQGILGGYLDVLDKYTGNDWITIYEGNATTQNGMAVLGETDLFSYGPLGVPYKITVSSTEFSGSVETVPILMNIENGMNMYALFGVENGEAIGVTSKEDADNKISNLGENATMVGGVSQSGMCGIGLQGAPTCEYTITKIERKEINGTKIFEGEIALTTDGEEELRPELQGIFNPLRDYAFEIEINGVIQILEVKTVFFFGALCPAGSIESGSIAIYLDWNEMNCNIEDCVLKRIYDVGPSTTLVEENDFLAYDDLGKGWALAGGPDTNYVVPKTVAGKQITRVWLDYIKR